MKYLLHYNQLLEKKKTNTKVEKILYHGALSYFPTFHNEISFFSETASFAENYASQKSMDMAADKETILYKVKFEGNIFDINNTKCYLEMKKKLPRNVKYTWNNFGFDAEVSNKDIMFNMKGYYIDMPPEDVENKDVGDTIKDKVAMSQYEEYIIYKKDDEYFYTYNKDSYNRMLHSALQGDITKWDYNARKLFKPLIDYIKSLREGYVSDWTVQVIYYNLLLGDKSPYKNYTEDIEITDKVKKEFKELNKKCEDALKEYLIKNWTKKFLRVPKKKKLIDTWRFYENDTVTGIIQELGYDGYIAREKSENTWCIFKPNETVNILKYYLPMGEFNSPEEIKEFREFEKKISDIIYGENKEFFKDWWWVVDRQDFSKWWREGLTVEQIIDKVRNKLKERQKRQKEKEYA